MVGIVRELEADFIGVGEESTRNLDGSSAAIALCEEFRRKSGGLAIENAALIVSDRQKTIEEFDGLIAVIFEGEVEEKRVVLAAAGCDLKGDAFIFMGEGKFSSGFFVLGRISKFILLITGIGFHTRFKAAIDFLFSRFENVLLFHKGDFSLPRAAGFGGVAAGLIRATVGLGDAFEGFAPEGKSSHCAKDSGTDHKDEEGEGEGCRGVELHGAIF